MSGYQVGDPLQPASTVRLAHRIVGKGPPLLLIAGTGYGGTTWHLPALMDALTPHFRVITFDHRGTGETAGTDEPYTTRLFAADALSLLRDLDVAPAHIVGHSMGGRVAQWMLLDGPELVRSAIMAATGPGQFDPERPVTRGIPLTTCLGLVQHSYRVHMERHIESTFFTPEFAAAAPDRVAWLIDAFWAARPDLEQYLKHVIARQGHQTAHLLDRIGRPCLVLIGRRDTHQGGTGSHWEQSRYLSEHLPDARLHVLEDVSHGFFWQDPAATAEALRLWVSEQEAVPDGR